MCQKAFSGDDEMGFKKNGLSSDKAAKFRKRYHIIFHEGFFSSLKPSKYICMNMEMYTNKKCIYGNSDMWNFRTPLKFIQSGEIIRLWVIY